MAAVTAPGLSAADALRAAVEHFTSLIDRDVKDPVLKGLQGRIWERGYASGELVGEARCTSPSSSSLRRPSGRSSRLG